MPFQILDNKQKCIGYYADGSLIYDKVPDARKQTWEYSPHLKQRYDIEYAKLFCNGKTLDEVCPDNIKDSFDDISLSLKAYFRSFIEAKISLDDNCFFEMVPEKFLLEFCDIKNKITTHVLQHYNKPQNYDFLVNLTKCVADIQSQKLHIDAHNLQPIAHKLKTRNFLRKIKQTKPYCEYNIFGTKTGRLTNRKGSFPILTLDKEFRNILSPKNDWFIELDYNAAELRTMLSLLDKEQPNVDIHEWNAANVYRGLVSREEAKKRIFAWLYNPNSNDRLSERVYNRDSILSTYWDGYNVRTRFNRSIPSDHHHALSYIIQSSCVDNVLRQIIKIHTKLNRYDTRIAFTLHDSIILDMPDAERSILPEIIDLFSDTEMGKFCVNVKAGKKFGELKRLKL